MSRIRLMIFIFDLLSAPLIFAQQQWHNGFTIAQCLELAAEKEKEGDKKEATRYFNQAATMEWEKKNYKEAITHFEKSIQLNQQIGNESGVSMICNNLGMIYADLQDYQTSLNYFERTLKGRRKDGEKVGIIAALINTAVVMNNLNMFQKSTQCLSEALDLAREMNDMEQMKSCYGMLAESYEKAGNAEKALYYFEFYKSFHEQLNRDKLKIYKTDADKAKLQAKIIEDAKRIQDLELAIKSKTIQQQEEEIKLSDKQIQDLTNTLTKKELAIKYLEQQKQLQKQTEELKTIQIKQIKTQNKNRIERAVLIRNVLLVGFFFALLIAFVLFRQYEQKRKINQQLAIQNQEILYQKNQIDEQKRQLEILNENLESQVQQRTQELINSNLELVQYNNQLEQFAFVVAHNLRAPVARIIGLSALIDRENISKPDNIILLDSMLKCSRDLDTIINDLNTILELKKGIKDAFEEVELENSIRKISALLEDQIKESKAEIITNFIEVPSIFTVKVYIESILYNLISNAIKYKAANRDPVLQIKSEYVEDDMIRIQFSDNGLGIDLEKYGHKLFTLYKRFHDHVKGKGMGLYLVKTQVEALQGKIEVSSKLDEGTTFWLYLKNQKVESESII